MRATFSECGKYRHLLVDVWDESKPILPWCLFNPSVAGAQDGDSIATDPTWTKGVGFSTRLGFGGQVFCNVYDYVSTDPKGLRKAGYPVSAENDRYILDACAMGDGRVICSWGALGRGLSRPRETLQLIRSAGYKPMALGFTQDGLPRHPLMLPYSTPLVPIAERRDEG